MEKLLILACLLTAGSAIFYPLINVPNRGSMMNICIFSRNPLLYQPKCFPCASQIYSNMVQACVNSASIPSNITYAQATCIEQNCAIGTRGKRSVDVQQPDNQLGEHEGQESTESSTNSANQQNDVVFVEQNSIHVVDTKKFIASEDYEDDEVEPDYTEVDA